MAGDEVHVLPEHDIWGHVTSGTDCPCEPEILHKNGGETFIILHNAFDHREIVDEARRILDGELDGEDE